MSTHNVGRSHPVVKLEGISNLSVLKCIVTSVAFRVPRKGEIYVAKDLTLKRCTARNCSRRAKSRHIIWTPYRKEPQS